MASARDTTRPMTPACPQRLLVDAAVAHPHPNPIGQIDLDHPGATASVRPAPRGPGTSAGIRIAGLCSDGAATTPSWTKLADTGGIARATAAAAVGAPCRSPVFTAGFSRCRAAARPQKPRRPLLTTVRDTSKSDVGGNARINGVNLGVSLRFFAKQFTLGRRA